MVDREGVLVLQQCCSVLQLLYVAVLGSASCFVQVTMFGGAATGDFNGSYLDVSVPGDVIGSFNISVTGAR